ncbi:hypothetical protein J6590_095280 [Homalodisca vitripennis]|nr:hypothetical protein J6590_044914 [Homalodisca vitripennis]KAG8304378.1 hypothetical protein J6590_095280 [Homalodisca vitripennis]
MQRTLSISLWAAEGQRLAGQRLKGWLCIVSGQAFTRRPEESRRLFNRIKILLRSSKTSLQMSKLARRTGCCDQLRLSHLIYRGFDDKRGSRASLAGQNSGGGSGKKLPLIPEAFNPSPPQRNGNGLCVVLCATERGVKRLIPVLLTSARCHCAAETDQAAIYCSECAADGCHF